MSQLNRIFLSTIIGFFLIGLGYTQLNAQKSPFLEEFVVKWSNSKSYTLRMVELMDETMLDFKPSENEMTTEKLLRHIVANMNWLTSDYLDGLELKRTPKEETIQLENLKLLVENAYDNSLQAVKMLKPHQLEMKVVFFAGEKTIRQILNLMDDHASHHRGQLSVYLRLNGVEPPKYSGW